MIRLWYLRWPGWEMRAEESDLCESPPTSAAHCSVQGIFPGTTHTPPALQCFPSKVDSLYFAMPLNKSLALFRGTAEVKFKLIPTLPCRITKPWTWLSESVDSKGCLFAGFWWVCGQSGFLGSGTKPARVQETFGQCCQAHGVISWSDLGRVRS